MVTLRTAAALVGLLALEACAPYDTVTTIGPPGRSQAQHDFDANSCNVRTAYSPDHTRAYEQCMHVLGYDVQLSNGTTWPGAPQYTYIPQPYQGYAPPSYTPSPSIPEKSEESRPAASAAVRFQTIVQQNQEAIFEAAHPTGHLDSESATIVRSDLGSAVIVNDINWRGRLSGRNYQTALSFTLSYNTDGVIESVSMEVTESGDPPVLAFEGLNLTKEFALSRFSNRLQNQGRDVSAFIVKLINSNLSVEQAVSEYLKYLSNNNLTS